MQITNAPTTHQFIMAQRCTQDASTMDEIETQETQESQELLAPTLAVLFMSPAIALMENVVKKLAIKAWESQEKTQDSSCQEVAETGSAFAQLDEMKQSETREVLDSIRQSNVADSERMYKRLLSLIENAEEEYPEEERVSVSSLRGFERFLKSKYQWKYPDIAISSSGNILIEWFKDNNHHVTIEFLGQATAKLVMLVPDITVKSKVVPVVTKPRVESIAKAVKPYDVLSWVTR